MPFPAHWSVTLALPLNNEVIFLLMSCFLAGSLLRSITIGVISAYNYWDCADVPEVYVAYTQPEIRFSTKSTVRRWNWTKVQFKILLKGTSFDSPPKNIRKCSINENHWTNIWTEKSSEVNVTFVMSLCSLMKLREKLHLALLHRILFLKRNFEVVSGF